MAPLHSEAGMISPVQRILHVTVPVVSLFDKSHYEVFGRDVMGRRSLVGVRQER